MTTTVRFRPHAALGAVLLLGLTLAGCGKEDPLGGGGGDVGGGGVPIVTVRMGNGVGAAFTNTQIGIAAASLSAGGTTSLQVTFVDQDGALFDDETISVSFASTCIAQGLATVTTPVSTTTGLVNATYTAAGCSGTDTITATATANDQSLTATGTVTVAPAVLGSIAFVSATPTNIGLRGTGGTGRSETSVVVFQVLDSTGGVIIDQDVSFSLNTTVGGISLTPATATTDAQGRVQTIVQAGTVATSVRVTASTSQGALTIQTQSDQLTITTGVPDQDSFSISADRVNPEALSYDGETVAVTVRMADRFNNPVPNGTAVTFTTEGGSIQGNCVTAAGACSVTWTSQAPRPTGAAPGQAGRVTILATAIGEESFNDVDGDGVFDNAADTFTDLPEAFRDDDEDGTRDATEQFLDFGGDGSSAANTVPDGVYNPADGRWNGLLCQHASLCGFATSVNVRGTLVLTMSGSVPDSSVFPATPGSTLGGAGTYTFTIRDVNGNPLPSGTTVVFSMDDGDTQGPTSSTIQSTSAVGGTSHSVTIVPDGTPTGGLLTLTVTTPKGTISTYTYTITGV